MNETDFNRKHRVAKEALNGMRNDVYPCREDIPAELWGEPVDEFTDTNQTRLEPNTFGWTSLKTSGDADERERDLLKVKERINWLRIQAKEEHDLNPEYQYELNERSKDNLLKFIESKYYSMGKPSLTLSPDGLVSASWKFDRLKIIIRFDGFYSKGDMLVKYDQLDNETPVYISSTIEV